MGDCCPEGRKEGVKMKWDKGSRMRLGWIVVILVLAIGPGVAVADFTFGSPRPTTFLEGVDLLDCFSSDGLEMYVSSGALGGSGNYDLFVLRRATSESDWGPPENLGPAVNSSTEDDFSSISADGLTLYFHSDRPGGSGGSDIWMTTRPTRNDPWGKAVNLGPKMNSSAADCYPWVSPDGLELYFGSWRPGGYGGWDIYVARRATKNDPWSEPVNLGPAVNSPYNEVFLSLSPDGLLLLFEDYSWSSAPTYRPGGQGLSDTWMARRATISDAWQSPVNLGPKANGRSDEVYSRISLDGRTLYYALNGIWQAPITPVVDFNGDLKVDIKDLLTLIGHWGQDYPPCDMGPMPWGDGKVDEKDLEVLMSYWGQELEVPDPNLVAHWKLDETNGTLAKDSASYYDATLKGNPAWQPSGGKLDGAILLDGLDDYLQTPSFLNASQGAFSVLAWVKGGAPGQVILSQMLKANWLSTEATSGWLRTELRAEGSLGTNLQSQSVITDGNWHRVGLVWDGTNRLLYVDDTEVARDTQPSLPDSGAGFYVGVGNRLSKGTFWSGLIDDVRIYNRAVKP
jgi:hypothetical protein